MAEGTDALNKSGGSIRVSFSPGRRTHMENILEGELMTDTREASYHLMSEKEALGWYNTTVNLTDDGCRYILKPDLKAKLGRIDAFIIFTNRVEHTLKTWVEHNQDNLLDVATGDLSNDLKKIQMGCGIPPEASSSLIRLHQSLGPSAAYEDRIELLYNCDLHVALLSSAEEKSTFRHQALLNVRNEGPRTFRQVEGMLNGRVRGGENWIQNAINAGVAYENVLRYRQRPYKNDAMSFLIFSRNVVERARQQGLTDTLEEIEGKLEAILPTCLAIFLEGCVAETRFTRFGM